MSSERRIERSAGGEVLLRLPSVERVLLRGLAGELRTLLDGAPEDPDLRRLSPPAYEDDRAQAGYRELMADELLAGRHQALEVLAATLDASRLSSAEADAWLRALNDLRLVLGTRLDVREETLLDDLDAADPRAADLGVYAYLTWLQSQLIEALTPE